MIQTWLELPAIGIFATLSLLFFGVTAGLVTLTYRSPISPRVRGLNGLVAPFFSSVAVLFALLTGFLANDVSDRDRRAHRSVQVEAGELRNIYTLSVAAVSDMRAIRTAIRTYVDAVKTEEWAAMSEHQPAPRTDAAYDDLLREVSNPAIARASGNAVQAALLNATVRAGTARNERLALSDDRTNTLKWVYVLLLALITQAAIALVHLSQPQRVFATGLSVFSLAVVVALGIIALQEDPFNGPFRVSPEPIAQLSALPDTPTPPTPKP